MRKFFLVLSFVTVSCYAQQMDALDAEFHWLDKFDTNTLTRKTTSFPTKGDYYASEDYPQYKFQRDKHKSHRWLVYSMSYNLLAVSLPTRDDYSYESFEDGMLNALVKYDYEHNAYDINSESQAVKNYVAYTANNGRSVKSKLSSLEMSQSFLDKMIANFKQRRATGKMTQEAFNKQLRDYNTETAKNKREIATLRKMLPSKEVIERADNYIRQLRQDNRDFITRDFTAIRIDGLSVLLQSPSNDLKIQQTGYFDKKENAVEWKYKVLEK